MWQTPLGPRVLQGAEGDLFIMAAGVYQSILIDMVGEGEDLAGSLSPGTNRWEQIPWHQQVCAIGEIARHMLGCVDDEPPELAAWNEIAIHMIYDFLMDSDDVKSFGPFVAKAAFEAGFIPKKCRLEVEQFRALLGQLRDRVLHDRDFDLADVAVVREGGLEALGLSNEYFATLFPAFTMERFLGSLVLLNEDCAESASTLLPEHLRSRFDLNRDTVPPDPLEWIPPL